MLTIEFFRYEVTFDFTLISIFDKHKIHNKRLYMYFHFPAVNRTWKLAGQYLEHVKSWP